MYYIIICEIYIHLSAQNMDRFMKKNCGKSNMKNPEPLENLGGEIEEVTAETSQDTDPPSPKRTKNIHMIDISIEGAPDTASDPGA